jgi:hypothetical protein
MEYGSLLGKLRLTDNRGILRARDWLILKAMLHTTRSLGVDVPLSASGQPPKVLPAFLTGLEERKAAQERVRELWHGIRSQAKEGIVPVVISSAAQEMHPPLKALGGLEEKGILLSRGDYKPDIVRLIEQEARSAIFVGLEEELEHFISLAKQAGITTRFVPARTDFPELILKILSQATGLEEGYLQSQRSFQEFAAGLESLATGA